MGDFWKPFENELIKKKKNGLNNKNILRAWSHFYIGQHSLNKTLHQNQHDAWVAVNGLNLYWKHHLLYMSSPKQDSIKNSYILMFIYRAVPLKFVNRRVRSGLKAHGETFENIFNWTLKWITFLKINKYKNITSESLDS